jgi:LmbE family N-acetylglucosaminyl deacetylase
MLIASPQDYMEDHMNSCRLALGGAFVRGMVNYDSIPPRPPIDNDVVIYHAMPHGLTDGLRNPIYPDFYIDVSEVIEKKAEMLACHESQKRWLDRTQGMGSYIETMKELNARVGTMSGSFTYAEGWRRHLHLGYSREDRTPLEELLAGKLKKEK